jgi:hypothetical protein
MLRHVAFGVVLLAGPVFGQRLISIPVVDTASGKTVQIAADLYGRGNRALLLAYGGRFNKDSWRKQAPVFARAGFLVLALNFLGDHPNPDGSPGSYGTDEENAADVFEPSNISIKSASSQSPQSVGVLAGMLSGTQKRNRLLESSTEWCFWHRKAATLRRSSGAASFSLWPEMTGMKRAHDCLESPDNLIELLSRRSWLSCKARRTRNFSSTPMRVRN